MEYITSSCGRQSRGELFSEMSKGVLFFPAGFVKIMLIGKIIRTCRPDGKGSRG